MDISVPLRQQDVDRLTRKFVRCVTEHGFDTMACKENLTPLIDNDHGVWTRQQKPAESNLTFAQCNFCLPPLGNVFCESEKILRLPLLVRDCHFQSP